MCAKNRDNRYIFTNVKYETYLSVHTQLIDCVILIFILTFVLHCRKLHLQF